MGEVRRISCVHPIAAYLLFLLFLFFRLFFCFPLFLFKTSHAARVSDRSFGSQAQIMVMSFKEGDQICGPTHSVGRESLLSCIHFPFFVVFIGS